MVEVFGDDRIKPRVKAVDDNLLIYFRLCEAGYVSSVREAETLDARTVLQALSRIKFLADYEAAYMELNK